MKQFLMQCKRSTFKIEVINKFNKREIFRNRGIKVIRNKLIGFELYALEIFERIWDDLGKIVYLLIRILALFQYAS